MRARCVDTTFLRRYCIPLSYMHPFRLFRAAAIVAAAALMLRLGGAGAGWLPTPSVLVAALIVWWGLDSQPAGWTASEWRGFLRQHAFTIALAAVTLVALAVRLTGLNADIGHTPLDIDEHRFAENVRHFFATGELAHDTVEHYPGAVFWMFAASSFVAYFGRLTHGRLTPPAEVPVEMFVACARMANVAVGAATAAATGVLGRRIGGKAAGLLGAAVIAIAPLAVSTTTVARNDPGMVLAVTAACWAALVSIRRPEKEWVIASGGLAGIATAIKYSAVFAIAPALLAAAARGTMAERLRRTALILLTFAAAVAITNHFVWYDLPNFLRQLADQVAITGSGRWSSTANPAAVYVATLTRFATGWPLLLLAAGFAIAGLVTHEIDTLTFLSFPLLYLAFMIQRPSQFPRWVYPLLPFVAVAGGRALVAVVGAAQKISARRSHWTLRAARLPIGVFLVLVLWWPFWAGAVAFSRSLRTPTHTLIERWIAGHVQAGSVLVTENKWLELRGLPIEVRRVPDLNATLDGGVDQLAGADWLIVPEPNFGHPTLRRLAFVQRFHAANGFTGNYGYDYEIYAVPKTPPAGGRQ
jgi:hypothetical protein